MAAVALTPSVLRTVQVSTNERKQFAHAGQDLPLPLWMACPWSVSTAAPLVALPGSHAPKASHPSPSHTHTRIPCRPAHLSHLSQLPTPSAHIPPSLIPPCLTHSLPFPSTHPALLRTQTSLPVLDLPSLPCDRYPNCEIVLRFRLGFAACFLLSTSIIKSIPQILLFTFHHSPPRV